MELKDAVALAGVLVGSALATAKLVADKESKIADVRRDWISGFRDALCDCLASAHVIAGRIKIRRTHATNGLISDTDREALEKELTEHWATYRHAFQMTLLHLNFSESTLALLPIYDIQNGQLRAPQSDRKAWKLLTKPASASPYYRRLHRLQSPVSIFRDNPKATAASAELGSTLVELRAILLGDYAMVGEGATYALIEDCIHKATMLGNLVIEPEWALIKRGETGHRVAIGLSVVIIVICGLMLITA
ncbi:MULTISPECIES: hypothetical protein [Luteibacter]|uniref:hypothetical protein n=1 Tax=Luteibacter TaxID=242605 RepID=UPI0005631B0C|nr:MULTISPECIES: hypothetical protein [unclassified Luteibacter]